MPQQIVWLSSYPKSGNTWMRAFLCNVLEKSDQPADINSMRVSGAASARRMLDEALGVATSNMTFEEIEEHRAESYRIVARDSEETLFLKCHDAYTRSSSGAPLVPAEVSRGVLYIVRNPLDVAVSLAYHSARPIEEIVRRMASERETSSRPERQLTSQVPQRLRSWSSHAAGWLDQRDVPVHLIRFEDMLSKPEETFAAALRFAALPTDAEEIRRAIRHSSFGVLQEQERRNGFVERPTVAASFFRRGKAGVWKEELPTTLAEQIRHDHRDMMLRLGYLP